MLKEFSEDLSSIKKIQSETKDTLSEIKSNLQENNSRMHKAENQMNDLEHKETKKYSTNEQTYQNSRKRAK